MLASMAPGKIIISLQARLSYLALSRIRRAYLSTTTTGRSSSQFLRSDVQGQPFTGSYEAGQPTRGPLGEAHGAPRLTPKRLKEHLDKFVVGQERAKKMLSVAVYNQYQRIQEMQRQEDEERERFAKIARRTMAYEKFSRHPTEGPFLGIEGTARPC
jgi:ATP-dependent Clp protease ATP-binding subunit ClpX